MGNLSLVTIVIIAANVIISFKGLNDYGFFERYKFNVGSIKRGEQIRMFSSGFLHVDTMHLFFNMFTLYFFADVVIAYLGSLNFIIVYIASLILGSLLSLYFHKDEYYYSAVGASGAVTGVLYSAILLEPNMGLYMFFVPIPIPGYIFGIGYLLYSIYGMKNRIGNIGHDAHFGGAVGGYIVTLMLAPWLFETNLLFVGLLAVPILILFVMHKTGKL
ncbi:MULTISPECIES: rhomboid family intramembrane serine protease [Flavobacteriaceae]|jgi:membrane associated rhomboid family serine protease|uniref:Rhomboid family protein n=1 Tax=Meridianimaribacter flavus TaxID=571115 RepID=A0ABY2G3P7_9FLAO|nr:MULTISPECIES: rhomboid family intramembrane serine protease [Flavobacteriaceae]RYH73960.1 rhomboid family intramembrane serine protease [Flavobacteriaceae bacterium 144Ye]TBV26011.1 rhomboid family intramembrane serine protease [Meridianimaribacter sp. CL38]TDY11420.1 rhomboid family protein [Meridianimaribacter flavus]